MCYQALKVHFLREAEFSQPTYRVLFLWLQLAMHDPRWLTHALEQAERLMSHGHDCTIKACNILFVVGVPKKFKI